MAEAEKEEDEQAGAQDAQGATPLTQGHNNYFDLSP
jgi:hypothetical protein